jgi:hypothetical protein
MDSWRLVGFKRQHGSLGEPLIEEAQVPEVTEVSYWRLAWFALSVAVSVFWFWFFTAGKHARSEDSLTWSVVCANFLIVVLLTLITSTIWLIILYVADHKKVSNYWSLTSIIKNCQLPVVH